MQQHNSLYRVYRPNAFKDVAGHQNIVEILTFELKNNNFDHAYLFAGQRGTGKTSVARILAKGINCLDLQNGDSCNACANCQAFNNNQFPDIYEIDAASNNGVDEIRNIKNNVQTLPIIGQYKVYIIDEVHMLSKAAFNALLKTLEEPPKHVVFILATTEYDKIPQTIISRCQTFNFKRISNQDLIARIDFIAHEEGYHLSQEAARQIYAISEGSLRDALNDLEQLMVVAYDSKKIDIEAVKTLFYIATKAEKLAIIHQILNHESQEVISYFEHSRQQGMDFNLLTLALIKMIKEIIEYQLTLDQSFLTELNVEDAMAFKTIPLNDLFLITDNLTQAYIKTKNTTAGFDYILLSVLKTIQTMDSQLSGETSQAVVTKKVVLNPKQKEASDEIVSSPSIPDNQQIKVDQEPLRENLTTAELSEKEETSKTLSVDEYSEIINQSQPNPSKKINLNPLTKTTQSLEALIDHQHQLIEVSLNEPKINYLIDDLINVLMGVVQEENPTLRHELNDKLQKIFETNQANELISSDEAYQLSAFYGAKIAAANRSEIIITTDNFISANLINLSLVKPEISAALFKVLKDKYVVYGVSASMWKETKTTFADLKQKNFLPEYTQINFDNFYTANEKKATSHQLEQSQELLDKAAQLFDLTDVNFRDK